MRFRYEVGHVLIGKILIVFVSMISSVYFSRVLQAEGRGELSVITSISGMFLQVCNLGLHSAHTYYVSKDRDTLGAVEGNIIISLLLSIGIAVMSYPIMVKFPDMLKLSPCLILFALCLFVTNLFLMLQENLFLAIGNIAKYNLLQILSVVFAVIIVMIVSVWVKVNIYLVAGLSVIAQLIVIFISLFDKTLVKPKLSIRFFLSVMPYGLKSYAACLVMYLLLRADILMLNYYLPKSEVGYYAIAVSITDVLYMFSASVSAVLFPKLSAIGILQQKVALMYKVLKGMLAIMLFVAVGLWFLADFAVNLLYGDAFMETAPLVRVLLLSSVAWGVSGVAFNFFASENRFIETVVVPLSAFVVNIAMNYYLIPRLSTYGAAIASNVSYVLVAVVMYLCMYKYVKKNLS